MSSPILRCAKIYLPQRRFNSAAFASLLAAFSLSSLPALAATDNWVGNFSANWSDTGTNWSGGATLTPASGDTLTFGVAGTSGTNLTNNTTANNSYTLTFNSGGSNYVISGNAITLTGLNDSVAGTETINANLILPAAETADPNGVSANLVIGGVVSDGGSNYQFKNGSTGTITFDGAASSTFTGGLNANNTAGTFVLNFANLTQVSGTASNLVSPLNSLTLGTGNGPSSATFTIQGASSGYTTQTLAGFSLAGLEYINVDSSTSGTTALALNGTWSRTNSAFNSTIFFNLSTNNGGVNLLTTNTQGNAINGIIPFAVVEDTTGAIGLAHLDSFGNITRLSSQAQLASSGNGSTTDYVDAPTGTSTTGSPDITLAGSTAINSLTINTAGASGANVLDLGGGLLTLSSHAILATGSNAYTIQDGQVGANSVETIIHTEGAGGLTISGTLSGGSGSVTKDGAGTLTLSGNDSYTGLTSVLQGTLAAGSTTALSTQSTLFLENAAGVNLSIAGYNSSIGTISGGGSLGGNIQLGNNVLTAGGNNATSTFAGVISDSGGGSLIKSGTGTLTLSNANTYAGGTIIQSGTLIISAAGGAGAAGSTITLGNAAGSTNATFENNVATGNSYVLNVVAGTGGTRTFIANSGNITYSGTIALGTSLTINNSSNGTDVFSGGITGSGNINVVDSNTGGSTTFSTNPLNMSGTFTNAVPVAQSGGVTVSSVLGNNVQGIVQNSAATSLTLSGLNTYGGPTTITSGTLIANNAGTIGTNGALGLDSAVSLANTAGVTLSLSANAHAGSLSGGGSSGGNVALGANTLTIGEGGNAAATTFSGGVGGTGGLTYTGAGSLTLAGSNTYSGATTVSSGTLAITGSLGNTAVTVGAATLQLNGPSAINQNTLTANNASAIVTENTANALGGSATLAVSNGVVTLSQTNNFTGSTTLTSGTLALNNAGAIASTSALNLNGGTIDNTSGAAVTLSGTTPITIGGNFAYSNPSGTANNNLNLGAGAVTVAASRTITLNGAGILTLGGTMTNTNGSAIILTVNDGTGNTSTSALDIGSFALTNGSTSLTDSFAGSGNAVITGPVTNGGTAPNSGLTYAGTGELVLAGTNTYSGATTLSSGTLAFNNAGAMKSSGTFNLNGGTVDNTSGAAVTLSSTTPIIIGGNFAYSNPSGTANNNLNLGTGAVTFAAGRIVTLNGAGVLTLGGTATNTAGAGITITVNDGTGTTSTSALSLGGFALATGSSNQTVTFNGSGNTTITGPVTNGGTAAASPLTYSGSGLLTLAGVNTYAGATTVSSGTMALSGTLGATAITLSGTGAFNESAAGSITSSASITTGGTNAVTLAGVNPYSGSTNIEGASALTLSGTLSASSITTYDTSTFTENSAGSITGGSLTISSTGATVISGVNTYSGSTNINDSPVTLNGVLGSTPIVLGANNGGSNSGPAIFTESSTGGIGGSAGTALYIYNGSSATLSGTNTFTGATNVNGGTLTLDYSTNNTSKISTTGVLNLGGNYGGATLNLNGGSFAQIVGSTTLNAGATTINSTGGSTATLNLKAITRNAGATLNFSSAGFVSSNTNNSNANGILGGWATVGGTLGSADWAQSINSGASGTTISAYSGYSSFVPGGINSLNGLLSGGSVLTSSLITNSLKINTTGSGQLLDLGGGNLLLYSNGLMFVGSSNYSINDGSIDGINQNGNDLVIQQWGAGILTINASIGNDSDQTSVLTKAGPGALVLAAANTYSGATYLNAGLTQLSGAGTISNAALQLGGTFDLNAHNVSVDVFNGPSSGLVENNGSGLATLTIGDLLVNGGANSYDGVLADNTNGGGGTLGFTKLGIGNIALLGVNTYSGPTNILGGTVYLTGSNGSITNSLVLNVSGGTLSVGDIAYASNSRLNSSAALTLGGSDGGGIFTTQRPQVGSQNVSVGSLAIGTGYSNFGTNNGSSSGGGLNVAGSAATSYSRVPGGIFVSNGGGGSQSLYFANAPTGSGVSGSGATGLLIGGVVQGSTVNFAADVAGAISNPNVVTNTFSPGTNTSVTTNDTISTSSTTQSIVFTSNVANVVTLNAPLVVQSGGILLGNGATTGGETISGTSTLQASSGQDLWIDVQQTGLLGIISANIIDDGASTGLTKFGLGTLVLSGSNTFAGPIYLDQGVLNVASSNALGSGTIINFDGSATLQSGTGAGFSSSQNIVIDGGNVVATIDTNTQNITLSGTISSAGTASTATSTTAAFNKISAGTLYLTAPNTFTQNTGVAAGTLDLQNALALQDSTFVGGSGTLAFDSSVSTHAFTLGGLAGSNNLSLIDTGSNAVALTVGNNNASTTYSGLLSGGGSLIKAGSGTLTLSDTANSFSGGLTVKAGMVTLGASAGGEQGSGGIVIGDTANTGLAATLNSNAGSFTVANAITVTGNGLDTILTTGYSPAYSGLVTLNNNNLYIVTNNTGGSGMTFSGGVSGTGNLILQSNAPLITSVTSNIQLTSTAINNVGSITNSGTGSYSLAAVAGAIDTTISAKIGSNVTNVIENSAYSNLNLSASNSFTGNLTILSGSVTVSNAYSSGTSGILLGATSGNANTGFNDNIGSSISNTVTVVGGNTGTATFLVSSNNTVVGDPIVLSNHNLTYAHASTGQTQDSASITGTGNLTIDNLSSTLDEQFISSTLNFLGTVTVNGVAGSSATINSTLGSKVTGVIVAGANTLNLGGSNTGFTGDTTLTSGTVVLNNADALQNSVLNLNTTGGTAAIGNGLTSVALGGLAGNANFNLVTQTGTAVNLTIGNSNTSNGSISNPNTLNPVYSGAIGQTAGVASITKVGTDTQTLAGNNTYTGTTSVTGGTLIVSGSLSGGGAVNVNASTLEADGLINAAATISSTASTVQGTGQVGNIVLNSASDLAPGFTAASGFVPSASLTAGTVTFSDTASALSLGIGLTASGTDSNTLISTGTVALDHTALALTINYNNINNSNLVGMVYLLLDGGVSAATYGTGSQFVDYGGVNLAVNTPFSVGNGYSFEVVDGTVDGDANSLGLQLTAVPEPGTWAMLLAGTGMLVAFQRKRRKAGRA